MFLEGGGVHYDAKRVVELLEKCELVVERCCYEFEDVVLTV